MPDIIEDFHKFRKTYDENYRTTGLTQTLQIRESLEEIESSISSLLNDPSHACVMPCSDADSPVNNIYIFQDGIELSRSVAYHAMLLIICNNIIGYFGKNADSAMVLDAQNTILSERIWMLHDQARHLRTLGSFYYMTPLIVSFGTTSNKETRSWILGMLNEIQGRGTDTAWTREIVLSRCQLISGRA